MSKKLHKEAKMWLGLFVLWGVLFYLIKPDISFVLMSLWVPVALIVAVAAAYSKLKYHKLGKKLDFTEQQIALSVTFGAAALVISSGILEAALPLNIKGWQYMFAWLFPSMFLGGLTTYYIARNMEKKRPTTIGIATALFASLVITVIASLFVL